MTDKTPRERLQDLENIDVDNIRIEEALERASASVAKYLHETDKLTQRRTVPDGKYLIGAPNPVDALAQAPGLDPAGKPYKPMAQRVNEFMAPKHRNLPRYHPQDITGHDPYNTADDAHFMIRLQLRAQTEEATL